MKNLKIKSKLIVTFSIFLMLSLLISALSLSSIHRIQQKTDSVAFQTLPNTECLWEMRRNLVSAQRYALMAFADDDVTQTGKYVDLAEESVEQNKALLDECKRNESLDQNAVQQFESIMNQESDARNRMFSLLRVGTDETDVQAFQIFKDEYKPLQTQQSDILMELRNNQSQFAQKSADSARQIYTIAIIFGASTAVLLVFVCIFLGIRLVQYITIPLQSIKNATSALAQGDFSAELSYDSRDEFGDTCKSIQQSFVELKRIITVITNNFTKMAHGDFANCELSDFPGEMQAIERQGGILLNKLNTVLHEITSAAEQIRADSDQVASGAQALAQGATEQASSVEELSASLSDISANVKANAENSKKANELAKNSGEVARATQRDMQDMLTAMGKISMSSESIRKVIKVIDDITFQTNILSLNAAVEAARAGVAGKGFAVVADEVRNLAQKSSESAKEITTLIESTIESVDQGEKIAQKTSQAFNELIEKIQATVATVDEIASASQEQAETIEQITIGVDQISAVVQTNSATSEESAAASEELSSQANILNGLVSQFQLRPEQQDMTPHTAAPHTYAPEQPYSSSDCTSNFDKY